MLSSASRTFSAEPPTAKLKTHTSASLKPPRFKSPQQIFKVSSWNQPIEELLEFQGARIFQSKHQESEYEESPRSATQARELKKVTEILPYFDYEPDPSVVQDDACRFICPRPDGRPCKASSQGEKHPECPDELALNTASYEPRVISDSVFTWEASNLYHNPLYFEDASLERYGHTHWYVAQPFVSVGKFGIQLAGLPYQMTIDPICKKRYTLGWYRPGECAPKKCCQIPLNAKAGINQAAVLTGLILLIP